ncbi:MAG: hypothetical protein N2443_00130 [Blastocatellia bacterium]|nr:hypothetical protein [Blastocatellia bacterium]MCX7751254.1 hypothetical protein [Blastocatellia bacterium]MDW8168966.1 hypothetical protein [Acidobacteriota bacterium]MDW8256726.1 hypothetical protein [Acidobacteriota bacterium]
MPGSKRRPGAPPLLADPPRTDEFALRAYGVRIGIRTDDPYVLDRIRAYLPPGWKPVESSRVERLYVVRRGASSSTYILYADARQMLQTESLEQLLSNLALDLHFYIAERARDHLFIHAGVVGWGGRAIVIPGRSSSGKTTLVRALLHCGATYYSDEYAVFDRHGCVHPFPTPLFFRREGEEGEPMLIETLGSSVGTVPLPVGLIVFTAYDPTCQWRPRRLSPGEALLDLLSHTISARRHPAFALAVLSRVASRAIALKGKRGEAEPTAQEILSRAVL